MGKGKKNNWGGMGLTTESVLAKSTPSGHFRFWEGEAGRATRDFIRIHKQIDAGAQKQRKK
jgi:hypothetical protein